MKRGWIITIGIMGILLVVLAVALASVGTNLDEARLDRKELQGELDGLQEEYDLLSEERQRLQQQNVPMKPRFGPLICVEWIRQRDN